jgi:uncharacterized protein YPO0396
MADEVEEQVVDETPKTSVKTYTQAEVDRLVNIQKSRYTPLKEELDKIKTEQNDTLKAYEGVITKMVEDMEKEVPAPVLKLLAKLSPLEQLEYLSDPENNVVFEKVKFPLPPKKVGKVPDFVPVKPDHKLF